MILGIGTDLCQVERMEKSLSRAGFAAHVFSGAERALLDSRRGRCPRQTAAANFAAKEAFLKACGTGLAGFALAEIGVLREASGAPRYALEGRAAAWAAANRGHGPSVFDPRGRAGLRLCGAGTARPARRIPGGDL